MGAALFDIVVDVIHVQVVCDQTVQAVGLIDAILDRIFSELHVADADESDGHHEKADEQRNQYSDPG